MFITVQIVLRAIQQVEPKINKNSIMKKIQSYIKQLLLLYITIGGITATSIAYCQEGISLIQGEVSYITGQNIYVKFVSTQGIKNEDSLFIMNEDILIPVLIVKHRSSISCLCNYTGDYKLNVADKVVAKIIQPKVIDETKFEENTAIESDLNEQALKASVNEITPKIRNQDFSGRLSLSSYSNLYNNSTENNHRFRYTLSLNAANISGSKLSFESYTSFSHKLNEWNVVNKDIFNALKIYNLALKYAPTDKLEVWLGRKINTHIANVGAIDGLQIQHNFKNFYAGAAVGFRPDFNNYGFNANLLEMGAYVGHNYKTKIGGTQSSMAFFEQRNNSNTDRRFIYFQHSNTLIKNISFFSTAEFDLYKLENGIPTTNLSLTGLYLSLNYRMSKKISLFTSYDARKNVIYYETFKNYADLVLQSATRQGLRARVNYRPLKFVSVGVNGGTRFQQNDNRRANTLNIYSTISRLPYLKSSLYLSANLMQTSYLNGEIYGANLSNDFFKGKLNSQLSYRMVNFRYMNSGLKLLQNIGELNLSYRYNKNLYFAVNIESTFQKNENYQRIYFNIRKKF